MSTARLEVVEGDGVVGGDQSLLLVVEILDRLVQLVGDAGELRVGMRVVGRPDDAVGTDERRVRR